MTTPPLLDLFLELRRRNLPLGVPEYLASLEALAAGFGAGSRAELRWMCQALWSKSPEENEQVAEALDIVLPREITKADLEKLAEQAQAALGDERNDLSEIADADSDAPVERESDAAEAETSGAGRVELAPVASAAADAPLLSRAEEEARRRSGARFDLLGDLPVPRRYFKRAWRYVRRMQRVGPAVELDVEGTVARRCREGVLVAPVLAPRRRNLASVLIFVDEGGSMTPSRQTTAALVGAARHSDFAHRPVQRLNNTLTFVYAVILGTPDDAVRVAALVNRAHAPVERAEDATLQLWVVATLYETAVAVHDRVFGSVSDALADELYHSYASLGTSLQLAANRWPPTRSDFATYWAGRVSGLTVSDGARQIAHDLFAPVSAPAWLRAFPRSGWSPPRRTPETAAGP